MLFITVFVHLVFLVHVHDLLERFHVDDFIAGLSIARNGGGKRRGGRMRDGECTMPSGRLRRMGIGEEGRRRERKTRRSAHTRLRLHTSDTRHKNGQAIATHLWLLVVRLVVRFGRSLLLDLLTPLPT